MSIQPIGLRVRRDGELTDTVGGYTDSSGNSDVWTYPDSTGMSRIMVDVVVPDFFKRIKAGEIIINPMNSTIVERHLTLANIQYRKSGDGCVTWPYYSTQNRFEFDTLNSGHVPMDIDFEQLKTLAGTKAAAGVTEPTLAGLVEIAESRETVQMLKKPIDIFRSKALGARARVRKDKKLFRKWKGRRVEEFLNNAWLSYRYGITPLIFTVQDLLEALGKTHMSIRQTSRGRATDERVETMVYSTGVTPTAGQYRLDTITTNRSAMARAGVIYEQFYDNRFGLSWNDVPRAFWELLPYSFVADWFLNLGDVFGAITPKAGVRVLGQWTSTEDRVNTVAIQDWTGSYTVCPREALSLTPGVYVNTIRNRTRLPGLLVGIARQRLYTPEIGLVRLKDAIALLRNVLHSQI